METFDSLFVELDSIERRLSRRKFIKIVVFASAPLRLALDVGDREFLRKVAATLIPPEAFSRTGIDVIANVERAGVAVEPDRAEQQDSAAVRL